MSLGRVVGELVIRGLVEDLLVIWWLVVGGLVEHLLVGWWSDVGGRWVDGWLLVVGGSVEHLLVGWWSVGQYRTCQWVGCRWLVTGR